MSDSKVQKQPKPRKVVPTNGSPAKVAKMPAAGPPHDKIRERAYELYEKRGNEHGLDKQDWIHAEQEILKP